MVYILEELAKISSEREIIHGLTEIYRYTHQTNDFLNEDGALRQIAAIPMKFVNTYPDIDEYGWEFIDLFTEAYVNGGVWGNENSPGKQIRVITSFGKKGAFITIKDEGNGFNYFGQIEKIVKGEDHIHHKHGAGMRKFHQSSLNVSYHNNGSMISIATPL